MERRAVSIFARKNHCTLFVEIFFAFSGNPVEKWKIPGFGGCVSNTKLEGVVCLDLCVWILIAYMSG